MNFPPVIITDYLSAQTVMSLAVSENNHPYASHCFYVYIPEKNIIAFKSKEETKHVSLAQHNKHVAGTIQPDTLNKTKIQGVQFLGNFIANDDELLSIALKRYYKKYPFALAMSGNIWVIEINYLKMTNNQLGIIKKEIWEK